MAALFVIVHFCFIFSLKCCVIFELAFVINFSPVYYFNYVLFRLNACLATESKQLIATNKDCFDSVALFIS